MNTKTKTTNAPVVLAAVEGALAKGGARKLSVNQQMIIAGVLAVYLEKARKEGSDAALELARRGLELERQSRPGDGILRFGGPKA